MENNNDKSKTVEFRPVKENKQQVNRKENDVYSSARKSKVYEETEETQNKSLIILAIVLAVLLIVAIIAGVIILGRGNNVTEENIPPEDITQMQEEPASEEEDEKEVITSCQVVFYGDSVIKKSDGYTILADLYDSDFKKIDNRKLVINGETQIRENGKRLSAEGLVYAIESMAGEGIVFDGQIRESDNVVLKLSYEGSFREEVEEEPPAEEETPENNPTEEEIPEEEKPSTQEPHNSETPSEGIVDGI